MGGQSSRFLTTECAERERGRGSGRSQPSAHRQRAWHEEKQRPHTHAFCPHGARRAFSECVVFCPLRAHAGWKMTNDRSRAEFEGSASRQSICAPIPRSLKMPETCAWGGIQFTRRGLFRKFALEIPPKQPRSKIAEPVFSLINSSFAASESPLAGLFTWCNSGFLVIAPKTLARFRTPSAGAEPCTRNREIERQTNLPNKSCRSCLTFFRFAPPAICSKTAALSDILKVRCKNRKQK